MPAVAREGRAPAQALEEHDPEGVDVGGRPDLALAELLRRHGAGRPHQRARPGHARPRRLELLQLLGDAEVRQARLAFDHEHVLRLEVSVHDPARVQHAAGPRHLRQDRHPLPQLELGVREGPAGALHDVVGRALVQPLVVDPDHPGVLEASQDPHLLEETRRVGVRRQVEQLERDLATQLGVAHEEHGPRAALPDRPEHLVALTDRPARVGQDLSREEAGVEGAQRELATGEHNSSMIRARSPDARSLGPLLP